MLPVILALFVTAPAPEHPAGRDVPPAPRAIGRCGGAAVTTLTEVTLDGVRCAWCDLPENAVVAGIVLGRQKLWVKAILFETRMGKLP